MAVKVGTRSVPCGLLAREVVWITDIAVVAATRIGGDEGNGESTLAGLQGMGKWIMLGCMIHVAVPATVGAGAEVYAVLFAMCAIGGRCGVTGVARGALDAGSSPDGGLLLKMTVDRRTASGGF